ncbi:putative nonspecific acid phosphatase [Stanieria sp. NIES-3757]|nr:putative nonspecific acid phosphatase [Stanieria sp. NIES-3757]
MVIPLSSWNDTPTKQAILEFVMAVKDKSHANYVEPKERIATFDNDGTLWCEKPVVNQLARVLDQVAADARANPDLLQKPLYRATVDNDTAWFEMYSASDKLQELIAMILEIGVGWTVDEVETRALAWLETARHPRFKLPYTQVIYQPMLELIDYLHENDFRVFICSGGGMDFMRVFVEEIFNIPRDRTIGSNMKLAWEYRDGKPLLVRQLGIVEPFNVGAGKPINIQLHIGRPPILTGGNSNGDIEMMEFAAVSGKPYLNLLVHHDDCDREYAYDRSAERALVMAKERNWNIISMKRDWARIFPQ